MDSSSKRTIDVILHKAYKGDTRAFLADLDAYLTSLPPKLHQPKVESKAPVIIELQDVERIYKLNRKNKVAAVQGVSLRIHEGEIVALTGPSGSGKSTLMHLIGGLDKPS